MTGYRLHIEATETEPTHHETMAEVHTEQRRLAKEYGRTYQDVVAMSYVMSEAEYQESLVY